ncbi:MAG: glycosyltransferase family 2 protein [Aureispira sp.]
MSSLSHLPYGKILDYWYEKLKKHPYRNRFLVTKFMEAFTFQSNSKKTTVVHHSTPFPQGKKHQIPIKPILALVIPVYAQSAKDIQDLNNLFTSIEQLEWPPKIVIIVDDNSPMEYQPPKQFLTIKHPLNNGPAKARNTGIKAALENGADIIAFTDADCLLSSDWTKQIVFYFQQNQTCGIISGNTISKDKHWLGTYHNMNGTLNGRRFKTSNRLLYGTTANLTITAAVAQTIQFNEQFPNAAGEDIEFCFRANKEGFEIHYNKAMTVHHHYGYSNNNLRNLKTFRRQFKKYGKGEKVLLEQIPNYYAYFNETEEITAE